MGLNSQDDYCNFENERFYKIIKLVIESNRTDQEKESDK